MDDKNLLVELQQVAVDKQRVEREEADTLEREDGKQEVLLQDDALRGNRSATGGNGAESVGVSLPSYSVGGTTEYVDTAKPTHADEM